MFKQYVDGLKENGSEAVDDERLPFKCDACDFICNSGVLLRKHITEEHSDKRKKCDKCNFTSTTDENIQEHKRKKHTVM